MRRRALRRLWASRRPGVTLSLDFSGVADADGLPAVMDMEFTWAHTDNASVRLGTESTYLLSARDVGKNIYVYVEYTDAGGTAKESIEISSWPGNRRHRGQRSPHGIAQQG